MILHIKQPTRALNTALAWSGSPKRLPACVILCLGQFRLKLALQQKSLMDVGNKGLEWEAVLGYKKHQDKLSALHLFKLSNFLYAFSAQTFLARWAWSLQCLASTFCYYNSNKSIIVAPRQAGCAEVPIHKSSKEFAYRTVSVHHHYQTPPTSPPNSPNSIKHQAPRGLLHEKLNHKPLVHDSVFTPLKCFYTRNKNHFYTKNLLHQTAFPLVLHQKCSPQNIDPAQARDAKHNKVTLMRSDQTPRLFWAWSEIETISPQTPVCRAYVLCFEDALRMEKHSISTSPKTHFVRDFFQEWNLVIK